MNTATHDYIKAKPAAVSGWRRVWQQSSRREVAFLSSEPSPGSKISGLILQVPSHSWEALDQREFSYDRHVLNHLAVTPQHGSKNPVYIYKANPDYKIPGLAKKPILLSYLDCVIQGYLQNFGIKGVEAFFESTHGWDTPIRNDRKAPIYTRAQNLSPTERGLVDGNLRALAAQVE